MSSKSPLQVLNSELQTLRSRMLEYELGWPPGHFYSPIPNLNEIRSRAETIFRVPEDVPGIDLNLPAQFEFAKELVSLYPEQPFTNDKQPHLRYYFTNPNYSYGEALAYYTMLRKVKPKRVVEIGSGYSSCVLLDINDQFLDRRCEITLVEPYPELLRSLLSTDDWNRVRLVEEPLYRVDTSHFQQLEAGDILFIDSTHVTKAGSDVNQIMFDILPVLRPGVLIHFHDICYPFEYPKEWILTGRYWNEAYLLRAFLQYNSSFEIVFFNSYMGQLHSDQFSAAPLFLWNPGTSIWIRKK